MNKTKLDRLYETPSLVKKAIFFGLYQARMLLWQTLNFLEGPIKTATSSNFFLEKDFRGSWQENGFLHLKGLFSTEYIDQINNSIIKSRYCLEKSRDSKKLRSGRVANIHAINRTVFKFLNDPYLKWIQRQLLNNESVLWGSLTFDVGSQQPAHADAPWFYVEPYGSMIGMWIALEDIHPDAGPLFYIPKSHLSPMGVKDTLNKNLELKKTVEDFRLLNVDASDRKYWDLSKSVGDAYSAEWEGLEGIQTICPKKGDVFIWHQWLVHGGSPITNQSLTRKSIVSHWVSDSCAAFNQHNFFLNYERLTPNLQQNLPIKKSKFGKYIRQYKSQVLSWD